MHLTPEKRVILDKLQILWQKHDRLERMIIGLERNFTDEELDMILDHEVDDG